MNIHKYFTAFEYMVNSGVSFDQEKRLILQTSLTMLKNENHFHRVELWGRIIGTERDYHIALGSNSDYLKDRKYFYSVDCITWGLMPSLTCDVLARCLTSRSRFTGNPAADVPVQLISGAEKLDTTIKEEDKLAAYILQIEKEAAVAPRGTFIRTRNAMVIENTVFHGLTMEESKLQNNYIHLHFPDKRWNKSQLLRGDYDMSIDFLDPITEDIPKGCWAVNYGHNDHVVFLRSLLWPGLTMYHVLQTPEYGFYYAGTGQRNWDLPHMIY